MFSYQAITGSLNQQQVELGSKRLSLGENSAFHVTGLHVFLSLFEYSDGNGRLLGEPPGL